jgi:hypothetical protein
LVSVGLSANAADNEAKAQQFFQKFDKDHVALVDDFYDKNVEFQDPVHSLKGVAAVREYYRNLYKNVDSIRFEFSPGAATDDRVILVWRMFLKSASLNGGKEFSVDGTSVIRFGGPEGKAVYHRDYFDMGEFVYERIPLLKSVIHFIKDKMADD